MPCSTFFKKKPTPQSMSDDYLLDYNDGKQPAMYYTTQSEPSPPQTPLADCCVATAECCSQCGNEICCCVDVICCMNGR